MTSRNKQKRSSSGALTAGQICGQQQQPPPPPEHGKQLKRRWERLAVERHRASMHQTTSVAPVTRPTVETSRSARRASTEGPPTPNTKLEQVVARVRHQQRQPPPSEHGKVLKRWECLAVERRRTSMHQQPQRRRSHGCRWGEKERR
jgi:hypothetical protein